MKRLDWPLLCRWLLFALLAGGLTACTAFKPQLKAPGPGSAPPAPRTELARLNYLGVPCYLHAVRWPEESLSVIARWYTGSSGNSRIIAKITPNLRANDLRIGDVVFIPQELFRRTEAMPRSFARRYGKAPTPDQPTVPQVPFSDRNDFPEDDATPSPFGPRTFPD